MHDLLAIVVIAVIGLAPATVLAAEWPEWTERVRISGSTDVGYFGGGAGSVTPDEGFDIWDARLFVDAELGESIELGGLPAIRNLGFTFEWNIVRNGSTFNDVGLAYLDLEGVGESPWLNLRVGRFQIPVGEAYKLYSKGYAERTFVHQPLGGAWWWDEGLLVHGTAPSERYGYLTSITNGDTDFNDVGGGVQLTLKLWAQPVSWLYVSASGLWTSELAQVDGALWLGESWARPFGSGGPPLPNLVDGVAVPDDPDGLGHLWTAVFDVIVTPTDGLRVWLFGGHERIDSTGASLYERELTFWLAELTLGGELIHPALRPFFVGLRADGISTLDDDRGYLLDVRYTGSLGYNMESFVAYTAVAGWRIGDYVTLRGEYSRRDVDLVRGAAAQLPESGGNADVFAVEFGLHF